MSSWTAEERATLIQLTQTCFKNSKIDWDKVSSQMKNRTKQQCKSYYTNIIKSELNIEKRTHHQWNNDEIFLLMQKGQELNCDWTVIQKQYFPSLSKKQLQCQFKHIMDDHIKKYVQDYYKVLNNIEAFNQISDRDFEGQLSLLTTSNNILTTLRGREVLDSFENLNDDNLTQTFQFPTSITMQELDVTNVNRIFGQLNVHALLDIYECEHKKRKGKLTNAKICGLIANPILK
ncbi:Conserved_hypothetical protein [Hexamita inflata]|uniref:Myb-like DNA-binding domain-containing protein n=1 Tax=Hexamita inflata TaxID=28002 RepID=A0AA86TP62_9EUKA|nr:Conserved hypothetical protein [Hexamita inflata]CAI9953451.1 Conserved hypothetical protein [Hexamita inflata]